MRLPFVVLWAAPVAVVCLEWVASAHTKSDHSHSNALADTTHTQQQQHKSEKPHHDNLGRALKHQKSRKRHSVEWGKKKRPMHSKSSKSTSHPKHRDSEVKGSKSRKQKKTRNHHHHHHSRKKLPRQLRHVTHGEPSNRCRNKVFVARNWYSDNRERVRFRQRPVSIIRKLQLSLHSSRQPKAKATIWSTPFDDASQCANDGVNGNPLLSGDGSEHDDEEDDDSVYDDSSSSDNNDDDDDYNSNSNNIDGHDNGSGGSNVEVKSSKVGSPESNDPAAPHYRHRKIGGRLKEALRRKRVRGPGVHPTNQTTHFVQSTQNRRLTLPRPSKIHKEGIIPRYANAAAEPGSRSHTWASSFPTITLLLSVLTVLPIIRTLSM